MRGLFCGRIKSGSPVKRFEACNAVSSSDCHGSIPTCGEVFPDATFVELVRTAGSMRPSVLLWDGREHMVSKVAEYRGLRYKPRVINSTILQKLRLPATVGSFGSIRELFEEICQLIDRFVRLPEKSTSLVGRFILATWLVDAMQTAPRILIEGPDIARARQLAQLLHCVCRRALPMSEVTPAALCSLPSGMRFTLLLHQDAVSRKLAALLKATAVRGNPVLRAGELFDFYGAQAILCGSGFSEDTWAMSSIRVTCIPISERLPVLSDEEQQCIAENLQPKLLAFRFSNFLAACATSFDNSKFAIPLQDLRLALPRRRRRISSFRRNCIPFCKSKTPKLNLRVGWTRTRSSSKRFSLTAGKRRCKASILEPSPKWPGRFWKDVVKAAGSIQARSDEESKVWGSQRRRVTPEE